MPKDPVMLLSYINLKLRDYYSNLDDFCSAENCDKEDIIKSLAQIDYSYNPDTNQFV